VVKLFISYSRTDKTFVQRLTDDLKAHQIDLWLDANEIQAGEDWRDAVWRGLQLCDIMLLVISPASMKSPEVASEWKYYVQAKKAIIPVLCQSIPVGEIHYQISSLHYIDFNDAEYDTAIALLQDEIDRKSLPLQMSSLVVEPNKTNELSKKNPRELPSALTKRTGRLNPETVRRYEETLYSFDERTSLELTSADQITRAIKVEVVKGRDMIIGRQSDDVHPDINLSPLQADMYGVSRRHAAFVLEGNTLFVKDLGSTNSTFVNQQLLRPNEKRAIKTGDSIQFGRLLVMVRFIHRKVTP
jgi:TIR domain/FHA domain